MTTSGTSIEALLALLTRITETPAPTFEESARARLVAAELAEAGFEPQIDDVGNVVAEVDGRGPHVVVAAHLDTVFSAETDVRVRREGTRLCAPGIGDNSASLAVLVAYARDVAARPPGERPRLTLAATVGEEGVGDLRGARALVAATPGDAFVALDGHLGTVVARAVGSRRFDVALHAPGGHSWGDYPSPSAVHAAGAMIAALAELEVPRRPRSSLNVGEIGGGTAINAIAERARFNLDVRSVDGDTLARLEAEARAAIRRIARRQRVTCEIERIGDRPAADVPNDHLVAAARRALRSVGASARIAASSTDANAALAAGIPAIAFGVYRGGDAHRRTEWLDPDSLATGARAFARLIDEIGAERVG